MKKSPSVVTQSHEPGACPCGRAGASGKPMGFFDCCGRFLNHFRDLPAPDAETLMRSRYSAFVLGRLDYLRQTWHPDPRPADLVLDPQARWLGLEVRQSREVDADHAEVEFVARHKIGGRAVRLHERSRFVREGGRWFYVDGDQPKAGQ